MAVQFYKLASTGKIYSLDKSTGQVGEVSSVPPGGAVVVWNGSGLPPDLQNAMNAAPTGYYPPTPYNVPAPQPVQQQSNISYGATNAPQTSQTSVPLMSSYYRSMAPGMSGPDVQALQNFLLQGGFAIKDGATGYYGPQTQAAVTAWQVANNIDTKGNPGYFGPISYAALSNTPQPGSSQPGTQQPGAQQGYFNPNYAMQTGESTPVTPGGTAYNMGASSLVNFADVEGVDPKAVWWVDNNSKTIRPFGSMEAFNSVYASNLDAALQSIRTVHPSDLGEGGMFGPDKGYQILDFNYAIRPDGTMKEMAASNSQLQTRYGQPINSQLEQDGLLLVDGFFNTMQKTGSGVDSNFLNTLKGDKSVVAFYLNALTYGGYSLSDIYRDIKKRELVAQGAPGAENIVPISASATKSTHQNTPEGQASSIDVSTQPPQQIGDLPSSLLNLSIYNIPDEAFKTLVPILDPGSPEFQDAMNNVETAYYDVLLQQLTAQTEQEKAVADYNWSTLKGDIEQQLGIQLSNNALDAWKQVEGAINQYAEAGIQGSGIEAENIDEYLQRVRMSDKVNRLASMSKKEAEDAAYYQKYATSAQIQQLIAEDQAKGLTKDQWRATKWGLVPSDDIKNAMSFNTLKQQYPNLSDEEINRYISTTMDAQGNYRSSLYQKYMTGSNLGVDAPGTTYIKDAAGNITGVTTTPGDYGALDIGAAKTSQQRSGAMVKSMLDESKAYKEFTTPESPFLRATTPSGQPSGTTATSSTGGGKIVNAYGQLQSAVGTATTQQPPPPVVTTRPPVQATPYAPVSTPPRITTPTPAITPTTTPTPTPTTQQSIFSGIKIPSIYDQPTPYSGLTVTGTRGANIIPTTPISGSFTNTSSYTAPKTPSTYQSLGTTVKTTAKNLWGKLTNLF